MRRVPPWVNERVDGGQVVVGPRLTVVNPLRWVAGHVGRFGCSLEAAAMTGGGLVAAGAVAAGGDAL